MEEIWKDIEGYKGVYQISNIGRVKSMYNHRGTPNRFLSPKLTQNAYNSVNLYKNKSQRTFFIHQLVAKSFLPNPENKKGINHIDGNHLNNNVTNLEWATDLENMTHAISNNLINNKGESNGESKLTESQVLEIDNLLRTKSMQQKEIANHFNVSAMTISNIKHRKQWKHLFNNRIP